MRIIKKEILKNIHPDKFQDFTKDFLIKIFKKNKKIYGYNSRVRGMLGLERIKQAKMDIKTKKYKLGNIQKKIPAIFLDKDGVIVELNKNINYQKNNIFFALLTEL